MAASQTSIVRTSHASSLAAWARSISPMPSTNSPRGIAASCSRVASTFAATLRRSARATKRSALDAKFE